MLAPQSEQARLADFVSPLMSCPWPQLGCAEHDVERWLELVWYMLAGHAEHVRFAVLESALIFWPTPHVACSRQAVSRCGNCVAWYSLSPQLW